MNGLTVAQDEQLRKDFPANVEGSVEFNEVNRKSLIEDLEKAEENSEDIDHGMHYVETDHRSPDYADNNKPETQEELREKIQAVLNNPTVRANALTNAQDIKSKCKGWFRLEDVARKLMFKELAPVQDLLNLLCLFQFAYRKEHRGSLRYKIQISDQDKLAILQEELVEAEKRVEDIKTRIAIINNTTNN